MEKTSGTIADIKCQTAQSNFNLFCSLNNTERKPEFREIMFKWNKKAYYNDR